MVKALVGGKEFANDKAAQFLIETMTAELKTRPIQVEDGEPRMASKRANRYEDCTSCKGKGCKECNDKGKTIKTYDKLPWEKKDAGWISVNDKTMNLEEGGDRVPEIAEAHGKLEDHTGIVKTRVVLPEKFAAEISTASAVKKAEGYVTSLKSTYLEAKVLNTVNGTRPVREAVESIYAASLRMADATKTLAKQQEQEEEESEKARKALETKKSSAKYKLGGLVIADIETPRFANIHKRKKAAVIGHPYACPGCNAYGEDDESLEFRNEGESMLLVGNKQLIEDDDEELLQRNEDGTIKNPVMEEIEPNQPGAEQILATTPDSMEAYCGGCGWGGTWGDVKINHGDEGVPGNIPRGFHPN
jgi:hypothetical protein